MNYSVLRCPEGLLLCLVVGSVLHYEKYLCDVCETFMKTCVKQRQRFCEELLPLDFGVDQ